MSTDFIFRNDAYAREAKAVVESITETGGIILNSTVFYAQGGGQPGDTGTLITQNGHAIIITNAVFGTDRTQIAHLASDPDHGLKAGDTVTAKLDWDLRYKRMRVHTALHLLSCVLPYPVTGGAIGDGEGRLDFDIPDAGIDKDDVSARLNELIAREASVSQRWITEAELDANPALVKTLSVQPPRGTGRIRLIEIAGIDLQPCGGTHVANTAEIGTVEIVNIEKKGKQNRRVRIKLVG
jgi:misacylated tRNA(Ala) deacylase